jgi:DNA gyrase/topoisomerase IV subunit B
LFIVEGDSASMVATQARNARFQSVLLADPAAEGIHSGALLLMLFHRWMQALAALAFSPGRACTRLGRPWHPTKKDWQ